MSREDISIYKDCTCSDEKQLRHIIESRRYSSIDAGIPRATYTPKEICIKDIANQVATSLEEYFYENQNAFFTPTTSEFNVETVLRSPLGTPMVINVRISI